MHIWNKTVQSQHYYEALMNMPVKFNFQTAAMKIWEAKMDMKANLQTDGVWEAMKNDREFLENVLPNLHKYLVRPTETQYLFQEATTLNAKEPYELYNENTCIEYHVIFVNLL